MSNLIQRQKKIERNKRFLFLGTGGAGLALTAMAPFFGVPLLGVGAYFAYDWFKFRMKNGMRF